MIESMVSAFLHAKRDVCSKSKHVCGIWYVSSSTIYM